MKFLSLFKGSRSRSEIVATFLSVLELCRLHSVRIEDTDTEQEIAFVQKSRMKKDLSWEVNLTKSRGFLSAMRLDCAQAFSRVARKAHTCKARSIFPAGRATG